MNEDTEKGTAKNYLRNHVGAGPISQVQLSIQSHPHLPLLHHQRELLQDLRSAAQILPRLELTIRHYLFRTISLRAAILLLRHNSFMQNFVTCQTVPMR